MDSLIQRFSMLHTRFFSTLVVGTGLCLSFCTNSVSLGQNDGSTAIEPNYGNAEVPTVLIRNSTLAEFGQSESTQTNQGSNLQTVAFQDDGNASAMVASQINSVRNYAMLQPINSELQERAEQVLALPETTASNRSPLVPLSPGSIKKASHAIGFGTASQAVVADRSEVTISAQSFQRGFRDNYGFLVANPSRQTATAVVARLVAPAGCAIHQVIPKPVRVEDGIIEIEFDELAPGEETKIEIAISYPKNELAQFQATIIAPTNEPANDEPANDVLPTALAVDWTADDVSVSESNRDGMLQPSSTDSAGKSPFTTVSSSNSVVKKKGTSAIVKEIDNETVPSAEETLDAKKPVEIAETSDVKSDSKTESTFIKTTVNGPLSLLLDEEVEFSIDVTNASPETAEKVVVQLSIPKNLKVTVLDRAAWYDGEQGKLTWEQESLGANQTETIRYKAKAVSEGTVSQSVATGWRGVFQGEATLKSQAR
jgi:uncharacterized repeat protein (TIGR01451 family)